MALFELLNSAIKAHNMFDTSNQEIYEAMMELKCVQESSESTVGIEDVGNKVVLTRTEALQAAWVLQKYMEVINSSV